MDAGFRRHRRTGSADPDGRTVPTVGAILIVTASLLWYFGYVDRRVEREGVARDEFRRRIGERAIDRTKEAFESDGEGEGVLVAVTEDTDLDRERTLVELGAAVADAGDDPLTVVRFDEVPDQLPLQSAREDQSRDDVDFEERMADLEDELDVPIEYGEIVSHDAGHAIVNFARHDEADLLVTGGEPVGDRMLGRDVDWIAGHAPCDLLLVDTDRLDGIETVALVTDQGPFAPLKVRVADAIAAATDAEVELVRALQSDSAEGQADTVDGYHDELAELFSVPVGSTMLDDDDPETIATAVDDAGLVIVESDDSAVLRQLDDRQPDQIVDEVESGAVIVHPHEARQPNPLSRLVERLAF